MWRLHRVDQYRWGWDAADAAAPTPGEILVAELPPEDWVWPDGAPAPRAPTADEAMERERAAMAAPRLYCRLALIEAGLWDAVGAWASNDPLALAYFEDAQTWRRLDPFVVSGLAALGLTPEQGDDLFREAMAKG